MQIERRIWITNPRYVNESFLNRTFVVDNFLSGGACAARDPLTGKQWIFFREEFVRL